MLTAEELVRRRRRVYVLLTVFLILSAVVCTGSYFGWFGWYLWGRPKAEARPVVAEGVEAQRFVRKLIETETRAIREDVKKIRAIIGKLDMVKDRRYAKYRDDLTGKRRTPEPLANLAAATPTPEEAAAIAADALKLDLVGNYKGACLMDKRMHELYRVFKTCELARLQDLSLVKAYEATDVVMPTHPAANEAIIYGRITSTAGGQLDRIKSELALIQTEVKSILAAGTRMLDLAAILEPDLLGNGSEWDFGAGEGNLYRVDHVFGNFRDRFMGQTGMDPRAFQHEWGRGEGPITKKELGLEVKLGIDLSKALPLPGRKVLKEGPGSEWMFVNSWYIIGPFPNPDRRNLQQKFPPEASIDPQYGFVGLDLDASYVGAGGKPVRWDYLASDTRVCFVPHRPEEWVIWYAYTEIWSEEEQDKFFIFGSDDYGQCWVNGEQVFTSGITPHPWVPDRDYAKVRLQKGFNPVLFKLENAWGRTGFSLCVFTGKTPEGGGEG